jgi:hypothetical protein
MNDKRQHAEPGLQSGLDLYRAGPPSADDMEFTAVADDLAQSSQGRRLLENHERFERALDVAMHDVPMSSGFTARIIAGVEAASLAASPSPSRDARLSRRRLLMGTAAVIAVAASLAFVLWPRHHVLDEADLQESHAWHVAIADIDWRPVSHQDLSGHNLPRQLRFAPRRYSDASKAVGRNAMAYDLSAPSGPKATLFVIEQQEVPIDRVPYAAPQVPQHRTSGYSVAYWQDSNHIYVVVVESDQPGEYRRLIDSSGGAPLI